MTNTCIALCARPCYKCFTFIDSDNVDSFYLAAFISITILKMRKLGIDDVFPKVALLVNDGVETSTQDFNSRVNTVNHYLMVYRTTN